MEFMLLIYHDEEAWDSLLQEAKAAVYAEYRSFAEDMVNKNIQKAGGELEPSSSAVIVRLRNDRISTTRGSASLGGEHLAGFFLIRAADINEAIAVAAKIPSARNGDRKSVV